MGWRRLFRSAWDLHYRVARTSAGYLPTPDITITLFYQDASTRIVFKNDFR